MSDRIINRQCVVRRFHSFFPGKVHQEVFDVIIEYSEAFMDELFKIIIEEFEELNRNNDIQRYPKYKMIPAFIFENINILDIINKLSPDETNGARGHHNKYSSSTDAEVNPSD